MTLLQSKAIDFPILEEIPLKIPDKVITNNKTSAINEVIDFFRYYYEK